jgi:hypothetical protein
MTHTGFYLLFVPGLTVTTVGVSFLLMAFAMRQGPFQAATRWGLASLIAVLLIGVALVGFDAQGHYRPVYQKSFQTEAR